MTVAIGRRSALLATVSTLLLAACALPRATAHTLPGAALGDVEIVDRDTGERVPIHWHQGRRYVAGTPGSRYAVAVRNRSGARVLAVIAVDGINAVSGETAAWDQRGYVLAPGQRYEIAGWRKSAERIAAFEFSALPDSYAARTGRPDHVGVIGVALFSEAVRTPPPPPLSLSQSAPPSPPAPAARSEAPAAQGARAAESAAADSLAPKREERSRLGTGHGRSETSVVSFTEFERARPQPDQVISIWYDRRENLIALGVIPAPRAPQPQPFPGSPGALGFVADPPR